MMFVLELRERVKLIYQKFKPVIDAVVKFVLAYIVFSKINSVVGYDPRFSKSVIVLALSVFCAVTPTSMMVLLAMCLTLLQIYHVSWLLAIMTFFAFIVLYLLFLRFTPRMGAVVVLIPLLAGWNLHYCIPLFLGLCFTPAAILPVVCGVFTHYLFSVIVVMAERQVSLKLEDILQLFIDVADSIVGNRQMFAFIAIFAIILLVVWIVRLVPMKYAFEASIVAGCLASVISTIALNPVLKAGIPIGKTILGTVLSGIIVLLVYWCKRMLDYTAVERVQFEDDDYYYYVKAVPKIRVSLPDKKVKKIVKDHSADEEADEDQLDDADDEDDLAELLKRKGFVPGSGKDLEEGADKSDEDDFDDFDIDFNFDDLDN